MVLSKKIFIDFVTIKCLLFHYLNLIIIEYLADIWVKIGNNWKIDNNVFLFSIDLNKKYKIKNNQKDTYYCDGIIGPDFCQLGFGNPGNLLAKNKCFERKLSDYYEVDQEYKIYEISGNLEILCKDLEVYKVEL